MTHEQYATPDEQRHALTLGMWTFLAGEILLFGAVFLVFTIRRMTSPAGFAEASEHLYQSIGIGNTLILLLSSFTMARAVRAARHHRRTASTRLLALTATLGTLFLIAKAIEYGLDHREALLPDAGFDPARFEHPGAVRAFMSMYLVLTGAHAAHLLLAILITAITALLLRRRRLPTGHASPVEAVGLYWHLVDIIWIFLLPLLYFIT